MNKNWVKEINGLLQQSLALKLLFRILRVCAQTLNPGCLIVIALLFDIDSNNVIHLGLKEEGLSSVLYNQRKTALVGQHQ